jgi:GDP-4-dehydro-6-deoxy-D-mannose reductase
VDRRPRPAQASVDRYLEIDLTDSAAVASLVQDHRPQLVFHLAGGLTGGPGEVFALNADTTVGLLDALRRHAPDARVLLVGSAAEYGPVDSERLPVTEQEPCRPSEAYGIAKHAATLAGLDAARAGMKVTIARPFNVIGAGVPRSLVLGAVIERTIHALGSHQEPVVRVGDLSAERDFVAVDDVVEAYLRMIESGCWGEVFNLCTGRAVTVATLVEEVLALSPRPVRVEEDPTLAGTSPARSFYGSFEKARRAFGFEPAVSIEDAVADAWRFATCASPLTDRQ